MKILFKKTFYFSVLYFLLYLIDSYFKNNEHLITYRYISKTLLSISLLVFYVINTNQNHNLKKQLVIGALCCFIVGDIFFITGNSGNSLHFVIAALLFIIAKVCYSIRFLNNEDFDISKLAPFLLFCFLYMSIIMYIVYNNLGDFFIPLLLYLFVVMMLMQFAYLRKSEVNTKSFWLVIIGVVLSMVADSINILKMFYDSSIAYNKITVMLFYGLSQFLIVLGILNETSEKESMQIIDS
ncbi:lysoplasmalogenase [Olleya sp. YS]|uniref:lysoplasmalogenase n=1 Tax=Olleya sp. YS TaxID=3028318 RepID=UPI0024342911|nr:lysoplasmalogenase [Olleya sp. YS]WGD34967.1 lysoplasmalogenase [Olleya sp. YS]